MKGKDKDYPQLKQSEWLSDLAFAVDLFEHMNELNTKLQGKGTFAHEMYSMLGTGTYFVHAIPLYKLILFSFSFLLLSLEVIRE